MSLSVREFLTKQGAIELLCEINPFGSRFEELLEEVSISRPTLTNRLAEGREVGFFDLEAVSGDRGTTHAHVLTPKGATARNRLYEIGAVSSYRQYKNARKYFDEMKEEFIISLEEKTPYFNNESVNRDNWREVRNRENFRVDEEE
ncbi:hypothetical protein [Halobellus clavatus]|nr:hypothetical protein [Halobellus clavatus]